MLESLTASKTDAIAILKDDHNKVKALFEKFENASNKREKKKIMAEAIMELKIHAEIEEKIFYPSVRQDIEEDLMNEADEEHHVAKLLIAELDQMDGSEDHWEAKFTVLAENIRHHIKEEEGEMMPKARKVDVDMEAIGEMLLEAKDMYKKKGVPQSLEGKLMAKGGAKADSPAVASKLKLAVHKPGSKSPTKSHLTAKKATTAKSSSAKRKSAN